jgi:hypothetical protein
MEEELGKDGYIPLKTRCFAKSLLLEDLPWEEFLYEEQLYNE